jgi:UPF0716 protein FxsA
MLARLILVFTVIPLLELYLLFKITEWTGSAALTFGLVVATGVIGALLTRHQGFYIWGRIQAELKAGKLPTDVILDGLFVFIAGVLLITPGVLTDCIGFTLLIPPARNLLKRILIARLRGKLQMHAWSNAPAQEDAQSEQRDVIIDSHVVESSSEDAQD